MIDVALYRLSIPFAIAAGTGAGVFTALSWKVFRDSPLKTTLQLLALVISIVTVYHVGLLVEGSETVVLQSLLTFGYVLVLIAFFAGAWELNSDIRGIGEFRREYVLHALILGILLYGVAGPLSEVFFPPILHWVHGFAAVFAIAGLYSPVREDIPNKPWNELILADPAKGRYRAEWMVPVDDAILDVLYSSGLVLTPAVIAYNIDYSREEVNRRLTKMETEALIERVKRGKYRIAERGERYVEGRNVLG
ncbi:hypothetical protein ACNS7O_15060 (plasmid) [Haloferacaceae archaeon DSL9]